MQRPTHNTQARDVPDSYSLEIGCTCFHKVVIPLSHLVAAGHGSVTLGRIASRLRCNRTCREFASRVVLVDGPEPVGGYPGREQWRLVLVDSPSPQRAIQRVERSGICADDSPDHSRPTP
jgi:hypothetical protein